MAMAEGASCELGLATGPLLAPESRLPLEAREEQVNSMLGLGSRLGSSAGLRGRKGEEEGKTGSFEPMAVLRCNKKGCGWGRRAMPGRVGHRQLPGFLLRSTMKTITGLEHLSCLERLRELRLSALGKTYSGLSLPKGTGGLERNF